mmetsp:Transcript_5045/g.10449  ORF Transcript_5045/g.10449 Transcript_5045/m.10449 type:complete len:84 (-) Transcript_5045:181-432(-)
MMDSSNNSPASWGDMYEQLRKFNRYTGNCNVPFHSIHPSPLARWLAFQRGEYTHFKLGRRCRIDLEKIRMLEKLGVQWNGPRL